MTEVPIWGWLMLAWFVYGLGFGVARGVFKSPYAVIVATVLSPLFLMGLVALLGIYALLWLLSSFVQAGGVVASWFTGRPI